jgi:hypothetical protein
MAFSTESDAIPAPPEELRQAGRQLWLDLAESFTFRRDELPLLLEICRTKDRLDWLNAELVGAPATVRNVRGDEVTNPVLIEARMQGAQFGRLLAQLRLPDDDGNKPQRRGGHRGAYGTGGRLYGQANR